MTTPRNPKCLPDADAGLRAIKELHQNLSAALESASDLQAAFESATRLADALREMADGAALTRAKIAAQMAEDESLSLAGLAAKLGVSKARADQLIKAARKPSGWAAKDLRREQ
ncbi:hypothetical protein HII36_28590 [Nonomuraea sp. NN258]|uniref:hypothetical protein n=1 Tax=Nonomuraea antri TaxID=2730852 RepID=UPI001569BE08|nr:hypothetical protein [Nonomuraea antri]NRQ35762.1 hypothetical protein [Nonomuraea antri]